MRYKLRCGFVLCCMLCAIYLHAQDGRLLYTPYTPSFPAGTIEQYIADIELQTNIPISYSELVVDLKAKAKTSGKEQTVSGVLAEIFAGQKVAFVERQDKILIVPYSARKKYQRQETFTINGYVKEEKTKEALIGAVVFIPAIKVGTVTNNYGFYSITIPEGNYKLACTYLGYKPDTMQVQLKQNNRKDFFLAADNQLEEVKVTSKPKELNDHKHVVLNDINGSPALLGENDVLRALQNIAGVQTGIDGTNSVLVRGGDPGQNLYLLDGVPVYYVDHISGLTSVFNNEAVKSVDFYKGAFPARYGGRLSSVIDITTKDGNMERWGGEFNLGLVKGGLNLEGPIVKNKASIMLSARRTWIDALWRPFTNDIGFNFYDVNGKVNYIVNKNNRVYLSFYNGRDRIYAADANNHEIGFKWGNTIGSARWTNIVNPKLFLNGMLTFSRFKYELKDENKIENASGNNEAVTGISEIKDMAGQFQAHMYPNTRHHLEAGFKYSYSDFTPVAVIGVTPITYPGTNSSASRFQSNEINLWLEDEIKIGEKWMLRPGLHWASWFNTSYNYSSLQPRIYASYKISQKHSLYGSFTEMAQFLHLINYNTVGVPADFWLPSTSRIEPEEALMGALGYAGNINPKFNYNVEVYYKDIRNLTMFDVGKDIFDNTTSWEDKLTQGTGWGYGAEFSAMKKLGAFTLTGAYTLSWAWRKFPLVNNGQAFPYRYDRRHNIKTIVKYQRRKQFFAAASWTYMSGEAITLPDQISPDLDNNLSVSAPTNYTYTYSEFNNYRLPSIHRLDVGFNFLKQKGKRMERTWSLGVFNAYGRRNVMYAEVVSTNVPGEFALYGRSFLQFIPYVTYRLKF
jgi:hypothetical protein